MTSPVTGATGDRISFHFASARAQHELKMPKRQLYFAPIDLVEDRTRTRVVGVGVMIGLGAEGLGFLTPT